jgi:hypothetical protein
MKTEKKLASEEATRAQTTDANVCQKGQSWCRSISQMDINRICSLLVCWVPLDRSWLPLSENPDQKKKFKTEEAFGNAAIVKIQTGL